MSAEYTNLIRVPGMTARVVVDADYDWYALGSLLSEGTDHDQAQLIEAFARGLHDLEGIYGVMQVHYISDMLKTPGDEDYTYDLEAVKWFLRQLLIRLDNDAEVN